jgi:ABC-type spermidine/putrescine transport system permease subunit II
VSGPGGSTLPMQIFSKVKPDVTPNINAQETFVSVGVVLAWMATRRVQRKTG